MCVTHGMPCVNMHGSFKAYIRGCNWLIRTSKGGQQGEGGGREKRKGGKEKRRGGKEKKKGGKEKKRKEEKRRRKRRKRGKKKEEKEGVSHSEETQTAKNLELRYER